MILLSDASILIDLGYVNGLELLAKIAPTEVLDVVLDECEDERQPGLVGEVRNSGVKVIETEAPWVAEARVYRSADLSTRDRLNLYYAKRFERILLAGDRPLRERCDREGVEVHGSLWLVEQAFAKGFAEAGDLCRWLEVWPTLDRRLPIQGLKRLARLLGC